MTVLKIPYDQLNHETLHGIIEEFVTVMVQIMEKLKCLWKQKYLRCLASLNQGKLLLFLTRQQKPVIF